MISIKTVKISDFILVLIIPWINSIVSYLILIETEVDLFLLKIKDCDEQMNRFFGNILTGIYFLHNYELK